jgi:hypothetical protein
MPASLSAKQIGLHMSKRRTGSRQKVAAAAGAPAAAKTRSGLEGPPWPNAGAEIPLADQPGEIGFCDFTKVKRVEITLRGEPFPHLLAA